jgi:hypothetical protein
VFNAVLARVVKVSHGTPFAKGDAVWWVQHLESVRCEVGGQVLDGLGLLLDGLGLFIELGCTVTVKSVTVITIKIEQVFGSDY